ncbi:MAG: hypothetical protein ACOYD0_11840 [Candidatus Nanopelagicales bacterium]
MTHPAFIGPILFEDENGKAVFTADWTLPKALRPIEVVTHVGIFGAHTQRGDFWVYRKLRDKTDTEIPDPYLTNLQDAPETPKPALTLKDVRELVLGLINEGNKQNKGVIKTRQLVIVADLLKELEKSK